MPSKVWSRSFLVLGAILLTFVFEDAGVLRALESAGLDTAMRLRKRPPPQVAIVRITDEDYRTLFFHKSPLNPERLSEVITAIAGHKPQMIGVDIDTSDGQFQGLANQRGWPPIVWGQPATYDYIRKRFIGSGVLGGMHPAPPNGLISLPVDEDDAIRRYSRLLPVEGGRSPSLAWAVLEAIRVASSPPADENEMLIDFAGTGTDPGRISLPAGSLIRRSASSEDPSQSILAGKIVLLGGDYAAQDQHRTPAGWLLGVEIWARIIETELRRAAYPPPPRTVIVLLQIADGAIVSLLFSWLSRRWALLLALPTAVLLTLGCSLLAYRSIGRWPEFALVVVAIGLHQLYAWGKKQYERVPEISDSIAKDTEKTERATSQRATNADTQPGVEG